MDVKEKLVEQAISHFWYGVSHDIFSEPVTTYAKLAIEALKKENGVTVQEWISVKDRLPEEEGLYLVAVVNDHERRYSKTAWYHGHGNWFLHQKVTHWQNLPQPPKGE
jgi:hypothetical protein